MTPQLKRYLFVEQPIGSFIVNFLLNALIAWAMFRHLTALPMWGQESIGGDTIGTCFMLPFLTVLITRPLIGRDIRNGKAVPEQAREQIPLLRHLPPTPVRRGLVLGLAVMIVVAPLLILALRLAGVSSIPMPAFVWVKAVWSAILGALLAPWIALAVVADGYARPTLVREEEPA
jgi:hypothetical protein